MTKRPRIPLTVDGLPQQRLVEVVDLPAAPAAFQPTVCLDRMPRDLLPKCRPSRMAYLGTAEWAWNPMSNRVEAYFLHRTRHHWVLWVQDPFPNDMESAWKVAAYTPRSGVSEDVAARHLIVARWTTEESEGFLDHFHRISKAGQLAVADWMAMGRAVWPQAENEVVSAVDASSEGAKG